MNVIETDPIIPSSAPERGTAMIQSNRHPLSTTRSCTSSRWRRVRFAAAAIVSFTSGFLGVQPAEGIAVVAHMSRRPPIGTLSSPVLGKPIAVYEGAATTKPSLITTASLDVPGAVHIPQTAQPGTLGVAVIAAHRTTWPRPFYRLDRFAVGDRITYTGSDGTVTVYAVVETKVMRNDAAAFADVMNNEVRYGSDTRLTLYACSRANGRPTSTLYRLVVSAVKLQTPGSS